MKIVHRLSLNATAEQKQILLSLGLRLVAPAPGLRLIYFEIVEENPLWMKVKTLADEWDAFDWVTTKFAKHEMDGANYLKVTPGWHHGYPMPDVDFGYLEATYDLTSYCTNCGTGKVQKAPFRMRREPKWGKRSILQLNWVFDEYFVLPDIWKMVFRPFGVGSRPVVEHRTAKELKTVVQLDIQKTAGSTLADIEHYPAETCAVCGRTKYAPIVRGFWPPFESAPDSGLVRTREYFGSGASAWNAVIISAEIYRAIRENNMTGVTFVPLAKP